jgi:hypothetical protein
LSVSCAIAAPPNIGNAKAAAIISLRMSFLPGIAFVGHSRGSETRNG